LTENRDGITCQFTLNGTYTVNPNGTGTITMTLTPINPNCTGSTSFNEASVLFDMSNGAAFVNISGGVALGSLTKQ